MAESQATQPAPTPDPESIPVPRPDQVVQPAADGSVTQEDGDAAQLGGADAALRSEDHLQIDVRNTCFFIASHSCSQALTNSRTAPVTKIPLMDLPLLLPVLL